MNWYIKTIFAQIQQGKAEGMINYLQSLGVSQNVIDYVLSQPQDFAKYLIGKIRNNPNITLQEIQNTIPPQKIDPYLSAEKRAVSILPPQIQQWALIEHRKLRKGEIPPKGLITDVKTMLSPEEHEAYTSFHWKLPEIRDWFNAIQPEIASYSAKQAIQASDEWHKMMAGKGEGIYYEPTKPELIMYGPNWKNEKWQGWTIQKVISENDLLVEGNRLKHCVGSYCEDVESGESIIYSLRDPSNNPVLTMETNNANEIKQINGQLNSEPQKAYKIMIKEWIQSTNNPGINSFEDSDDPMDQISSDYYGMAEIVEALEGLVDEDYGIKRTTNWDADDIAEKAIQIELGSRNPEYSGDITNIPQAIINMLISNYQKNPKHLQRQLNMLEKYLYKIEEKIWDDAMSWDMGSYENYPEEEDYETIEEFEKAKEEYEEQEQEWKDEEIRKTPQGGFAAEGIQLINELEKSGIYKIPKEKAVIGVT